MQEKPALPRVKNADYEQALVPADDMVCLGFFNGK